MKFRISAKTLREIIHEEVCACKDKKTSGATACETCENDSCDECGMLELTEDDLSGIALARYVEGGENLTQVVPPGWEGTVKKMKKDKDIDNPWALAWHLKNKGASPNRKKDQR